MFALVRGGRGLVFSLAVVAAGALVGCSEPEEAPPPSTTGYAGSAQCATCHAEIAESWQTSFHRLAMLDPAAEGASHARPDADGPLVARDGGLVMTAKGLGHDSDVPVRWVLGHRHIEQLIGPVQPGRLQALPLAWDVDGKEWFDLFEGEARTPRDWGHWTNRGMEASMQCFFCHTTGYDKGYRPDTDDYDAKWIELGVGCEACHGPSAEHAAAPDADTASVTPIGIDDDDDLMLAACGACHSRRIERAPFEPGKPFLDAFEPELLDTDAYHPDGQVKEELYELVSFQMSRMHFEGVRCWDCHDAHTNATRQPGNSLCLTCHEPGYDSEDHTHHATGSEGASCIGCHMPVTVYMQRDARHDHSFSRPDPETTLELGVPNACNRCHDDQDAEWAAERVRQWYPDDGARKRRREIARVIAQGRQGDPAATEGLLALLTGDADEIRRASAARLLARFPTSPGVSEALVTALNDDEALVRLGATWALAQRQTHPREVEAALAQRLDDARLVVRQQAALALRRVDPHALPPDRARALTAATDEWIASQQLAGDTPEAHYNLAIFRSERGDVPGAITAYRTALRQWPASIQARHNLGMLLAQTGQLPEAEVEFRTLLEYGPVPETAFSLGLLYGQQGRWPEAADALRRCLEENPSYPRARYNLALALAKSGQVPAALDELERATEDQSSRREAILTLVDLARQTNDKDRMQRWVLEAAKLDPSVMENPELRALIEGQ